MTNIARLLCVPAAALAAFLFSATVQAQDADTVVATLNGTPITLGEVAAFQQTIPSAAELDTMEILPQLLNFYIDQQLVITAAQGRGLENDEQVKAQLERLKNELVRQAFLRDEIRDRVTPERLEAEYNRRLETMVQEQEIKARHILVDSQDDAEALLTALNDGADFAALARDNSTGPSGPNGGDLGWFTAGTMVPEFSQAAFALEPGQVSPAPVQTDFGWHVIKVEDSRLKPLPTFEEMLPQIRDELSDEAVESVMAELRGRATVEILQPAP